MAFPARSHSLNTKLIINASQLDRWPQLRQLSKEYLSQVTKFAYFEDNLFAITKFDKVIAVGANEHGYLGLGHADRVEGGQEMKELEGKRVTEIVCGPNHVMARTRDGKVYGWGDNTNGLVGEMESTRILTPQLIFEGGVSSVKAGAEFTAILKRSGQVYVWGRIDWSDDETRPQDYQRAPVLLSFGDTLESVREIDCGLRHLVAITRSGVAYGWGCNRFGQLGVSRFRFLAVRRPIQLRVQDKPAKLKHVSCGSFTTILVSIGDGIFQCGNLVFTFQHIFESHYPVIKVHTARVFSDYQIDPVSTPPDMSSDKLVHQSYGMCYGTSQIISWESPKYVMHRSTYGNKTVMAQLFSVNFYSSQYFVVPTMVLFLNDQPNLMPFEVRPRRAGWLRRLGGLFCFGGGRGNRR